MASKTSGARATLKSEDGATVAHERNVGTRAPHIDQILAKILQQLLGMPARS